MQSILTRNAWNKQLSYSKKIILNLGEWVWPHICSLCGEKSMTGRDLCNICIHSLPWISAGCYRCGLRLQEESEHVNCEKCHFQKPNFDRLCAVFSYDKPVIKLVRGLKFGGQLAFGKILGDFLLEKIEKEYQNDNLPDALIPMPLYSKRLRKRGFNQALELAKPLVKKYNIPLLLKACYRVKPTKPQSGLSALARWKNVEGVFKTTKELLANINHIAIVDDVVTTASTVNALSKTLKDSGVNRVDVWCSCRA